MDREEQIKEAMRKYNLPDYMENGVINYVIHHIKPGSFLSGVLSNNLYKAIGSADSTNIQKIKDWVIFVVNEVPSDSLGKQNFHEWINQSNDEQK